MNSRAADELFDCSPFEAVLRRNRRAEKLEQQANKRIKRWGDDRGKDFVPAVVQANYGLSEEQINSLSATQGGKCGICDAPWEVIDHCHETGRVRGLLCSPCNIGIGLLGDNLQNLGKAVAYLQSSELGLIA